MDKKTKLLDENASLEERRQKDRVILDKVILHEKLNNLHYTGN